MTTIVVKQWMKILEHFLTRLWKRHSVVLKEHTRVLMVHIIITFIYCSISCHSQGEEWGRDGCKTIHHPHNVSERLGVIHISADAKFAHLKRGITGLKHAYHAFTIIFLVCQPTLRPPLTPWWYFGSDPSPLRSSADIWWPLMYI